MARIATEPAPNIARYCTKAPPQVCAWFHKALRKNPSERFSTAREMAEAFVAATRNATAMEWSSPEIDLRALLEARKRYEAKSIEPSTSRIFRRNVPKDLSEDGLNAEATLSISDLEFDAVMSAKHRDRPWRSIPPGATLASNSDSAVRETPPPRVEKRARSVLVRRIAAVALLFCLAILVGIALGARSSVTQSDRHVTTGE